MNQTDNVFLSTVGVNSDHSSKDPIRDHFQMQPCSSHDGLFSEHSSGDLIKDHTQTQPCSFHEGSHLIGSLQTMESEEMVENAFASFIASLYANQSLPRNIVQTVMDIVNIWPYL